MIRKPRLLIIGHARHGKDTLAELLRDRHGLTFRGSSEFACKVAVMPWLSERGVEYGSVAQCYADRHAHRAAWFDAISSYNTPDKSRFAREILDEADCYVGMRNAAEYRAARHLFDLVVWVDASRRGKEVEPRSSMSITFNAREMVHVDNGGTPEQLAQCADWLMANWRDLQEQLAA